MPSQPSILVAGLLVAATGLAQEKPSIEGRIVPVRELVVVAATGGRVVEVAVAGQPVAAGDVLVRLEDAGLEIAVREAEVEIEQAEVEIEMARLAVRGTAGHLEGAREEADRAARHHDRIRGLVEKGLANSSELDASEAALAQARRRIDALELELEEARLGERVAAGARLAATLSLERARQSLAGLVQRAPFAGVVAAVHVDVGEAVAPGRTLAWILDPSELRFEALAPIVAAGRLAIDKQVRVVIPSLDLVVEGRIERIGPVALAGEDGRGGIPVTVRLGKVGPEVRPGLQARLAD